MCPQVDLKDWGVEGAPSRPNPPRRSVRDEKGFCNGIGIFYWLRRKYREAFGK